MANAVMELLQPNAHVVSGNEVGRWPKWVLYGVIDRQMTVTTHGH